MNVPVLIEYTDSMTNVSYLLVNFEQFILLILKKKKYSKTSFIEVSNL